MNINPSLTQRTFSVFWQHVRRYRWQFLVVIFSVFVVTLVQTYVGTLYRDMIDALSLIDKDEAVRQAIQIIIMILGVNMIEVTFWRIADFVNNAFQAHVMRDLINTCYSYLQRHSYGFFSSNFVGSLVTKVKRYEKAFELIANQLCFEFGRTLLIIVMILWVLLRGYPFFGYAMLVWCVAYLAFVYYFARFKMKYDAKKTKADTETTAQLADSITNNVNIKTFSNYELEEKRFGRVTELLAKARKKVWDIGVIGEGTQAILVVGLEFYIVYISIGQWRDGALSIGDLVLLQTYLVRMYEKLWGAGKNIKHIYEAISDANEMTAILEQPQGVSDVKGATMLQVERGAIEMKKVTFNYEQRRILTDFNFRVAPGERVAFVGPSGGGKSTLLKLLLRFYDVQGGSILIDGQNIATVTQDSLRSAISLVPQDPILFHRSLMENIRYAKPSATDEEVIRAAKLAHAHEFIEKLTLGYNTFVGERGIKLSGGERQRVAIARAILKDAPILILDEATSSLDSESEMLIQDALATLMKGRTTIVVAHRLSTIMAVDRIVVISEGTILEEGKHEELLKAQEGTYQRLWEIQAGGFNHATG